MSVTPDSAVDVQLQFYDGSGALVATSDMNGAGGLEGLRFSSWTSDSIVYVLVSDAGSAVANPYRICVDTAP